jgi:hypothetical protein
MNKIRNYWKNKKGITLVWGAFFLILCLMFLGLAVDIGYMYVVKNQLQVASDAAALAGAARLTGESDDKNSAYRQEPARQEAWKFACKNKAANSPVFLVSQRADCNNPPNYQNLNGDNNFETNDIVVGHWSSTPINCPSTGRTENFCRADGNTRLSINAIKAGPRRTGETPGMPRVKVFLGQIFRIIKADWSTMSARAQAIALIPPSSLGPFPMCESDCGRLTPLTTTAPNLTPGLRWFLKTKDGPPIAGWTTYLDNSTSQPDITAYILGKTPPDICNQCIYTNNGVVNPSMCAVRQRIKEMAGDHIVNGVTIHGWLVTIPILPNTPCPSAKGTGCFTDPGYQPGDPFQVFQYADVILTDGVPQGNCPGDPGPFAAGKPGLVFVGTGPGGPGFSSISCYNCNDPSIKKLIKPPKLVK